ncbi:LysR family transcriptional regulator [Jannaschia seohaensis]|uniref:DNA-binding transcriptional LysR family regulator n=1 Tax=Jannaschia seohaensis TaxID=475081 RepID=A0A2Y9A7C6_9RHOB|nr:LysR family transcriptional regulator [Jannaschia seohaensis]PWJ21799.1 DNA-binding transcriptional LysR family regulator [Jannaschia seohaensis]SSA38077.1 DNA-binding transcriptional regulator, LysR family [Jannaschia seohaensis]
MTIRLLRTLVAVADTRTFSAAAKRVHVTHAAVSQQMQALEADLGLELFDRSRRTPELTRLGHAVVERARLLIRDYDALVPSVLGTDGLGGEIAFGALPTTLTGLTPRSMAALKARWPDVALHIRPGLTFPLVGDIERGALDAAIVTWPHAMPAGLEWRALAEEPLHLIVSRQTQGDDPFELLSTRPFIRFTRAAAVGILIDNWITEAGLRVRETMELGSLEAITSMVHADLGVSIVPRRVVEAWEQAPVRQLSLGPNAPTRSIGLVARADAPRPRVTDELEAAFRSVIDAEGRT